jgi:hypothetical protein
VCQGLACDPAQLWSECKDTGEHIN